MIVESVYDEKTDPKKKISVVYKEKERKCISEKKKKRVAADTKRSVLEGQR